MRKKRTLKGCFLRVLLFLALVGAVAAAAHWGLTYRERLRYAREGMPIAPVFQYDYPEAVCTIGGVNKSVASSGCGAVCMSMAIDFLTGDTLQTPQTLFEEAYQNGDYTGYGLTHEAMDHLAEAHGISAAWISGDEKAIRSALRSGYPIIAHMGPGSFTREGHYILLRGVTENGSVLVNDPNSESRTWSTWDLQDIIREAKGEKPFMVCRKG